MNNTKDNTPKVRFHRKKSGTKYRSRKHSTIGKNREKYCRRSYILERMTIGIDELPRGSPTIRKSLHIDPMAYGQRSDEHGERIQPSITP